MFGVNTRMINNDMKSLDGLIWTFSTVTFTNGQQHITYVVKVPGKLIDILIGFRSEDNWSKTRPPELFQQMMDGGVFCSIPSVPFAQAPASQ